MAAQSPVPAGRGQIHVTSSVKMKILCAAAVWVGLSHHRMLNRTDEKKSSFMKT